MMETDLWWMTALIFLPTVFALLLLFIPNRNAEAIRWTALVGTAATLAVSLVIFIGFLDMPDKKPLAERADSAAAARAIRFDAAGTATGARPPASGDWVARVPWIERFHIEYFLGLDGISMPLILLTTLLSFLSAIASWGITRYVKGYFMLFLLLETGMVGCFVALDFFLFYIFWEVMLLPMYFLIGIWGGPRREYAAIKFFLYTLLGSVFILIALLGFYFTDVRDFVDPTIAIQEKAYNVAYKVTGSAAQARIDWPKYAAQITTDEVHTFDLLTLFKTGKGAALVLNGKQTDLIAARKAELEAAKLPAAAVTLELEGMAGRLQQPFFNGTFQVIMFLLLFVGFAIKVPVFPFHTWLPDAHVEAPTPISMILAGVLLKLGGYGILRIAYPVCPWAAEQLAYFLAVLGIVNIVYGAFAAMAQTDFKRLVAYSSVSHMGYVILGIAVWSAQPRSQYWSWAMNGAMFQMIAHGITSAGMFFLVGVVYDRAHHRNLNNFRGLFEPMPVYGGISFLIFFAAMGLPGMCGFVGEVFVVLGTWNYSKWMAVLAALTVVITAAYILWTVQRVFLGTNPAYKDFPDLSLRELSIGVPLLVLAVLLGVLPSLLLNWMEPSVTGLVEDLARLGGG